MSDLTTITDVGPKLYRYDHAGTRYYARVTADATGKPQVLWYPSVTSLVKATSPMPYGLLKFYATNGMDDAKQIAQEAADAGTELHILFSRILTGDVLYTQGLADTGQLKPVLSFMAFVKDYDVKPLYVEHTLYIDDLSVAGTVDLVCEMTFNKKRITAVVDYKTGNGTYRDHAVQLAYYQHMHNANPLTVEADKATHCFVLRTTDWKDKPSYELKNWTGTVTHEELQARSVLYKATCPMKPTRTKSIYAGDVGYGLPLPTVVEVITPDAAVLDRALGLR